MSGNQSASDSYLWENMHSWALANGCMPLVNSCHHCGMDSFVLVEFKYIIYIFLRFMFADVTRPHSLLEKLIPIV